MPITLRMLFAAIVVYATSLAGPALGQGDEPEQELPKSREIEVTVFVQDHEGKPGSRHPRRRALARPLASQGVRHRWPAAAPHR